MNEWYTTLFYIYALCIYCLCIYLLHSVSVSLSGTSFLFSITLISYIYIHLHVPIHEFRVFNLPLGLHELIVDFLPNPRIWKFSLNRLKRRITLAAQPATLDISILLDEMLTDMVLFHQPDQAGHLIQLSRHREVAVYLSQYASMPPNLVDDLVQWSDVQSLIFRMADCDVTFKPNLARRFLFVSFALYRYLSFQGNPCTLFHMPELCALLHQRAKFPAGLRLRPKPLVPVIPNPSSSMYESTVDLGGMEIENEIEGSSGGGSGEEFDNHAIHVGPLTLTSTHWGEEPAMRPVRTCWSMVGPSSSLSSSSALSTTTATNIPAPPYGEMVEDPDDTEMVEDRPGSSSEFQCAFPPQMLPSFEDEHEKMDDEYVHEVGVGSGVEDISSSSTFKQPGVRVGLGFHTGHFHYSSLSTMSRAMQDSHPHPTAHTHAHTHALVYGGGSYHEHHHHEGEGDEEDDEGEDFFPPSDVDDEDM